MGDFYTIWQDVIRIGSPILIFIFAVTFWSINVYFKDCKNLRLMENYIHEKGNLMGYKYKSITYIGAQDFSYAFKSLSHFDPECLKIKRFRDQLETIRIYRKIYAIVFLGIILISSIGITMNEFVFNK